jgi:hypothetical protein
MASAAGAGAAATRSSQARPSAAPATHHSGHDDGHHAAKKALAIHVKGRHLVNSHGHRVRLLGFNNSGAEYACEQGWGIFDVHSAPNTSVPTNHVTAMASWAGANTVRVPLNEQCWLGIGGVDPQYAGKNYRQAIKTYVHQLTHHGFAVVLDLHLSAPGHELSSNQEEMPDHHSIAFWTKVAHMFRSDRAVLFDLFNEPWPDDQSHSRRAWHCWRDGGCQLTSQNGGAKYTAVGMNRLIRAVRSTGARNVVLAGGLDYASDLNHWLHYKPHDPDHELAASLHAYNFGGCHSRHCYNAAPKRVSHHVPLVIGEFGPDLTVVYPELDAGCPSSDSTTTSFDSTLFDWAQHHHVSWLAWTWNPWNDCFALVKGFSGHPTSPYGVRVRKALKANRQSHRA